ncbi:alpha/beta fold hydrolase [Halococcus saccharolyticus]|uniref:Alpha/beta hydrolase fold protein n=1 Tax=Halococcus saccharolyticus DSM 5350 TaxID=1227455 RepID=M0MGC4_9EURY|nr:alpha/beta hydrolase [Halococcus saccharolyticus]EMA44787.1 alpha/beta hydrolase fold protein [Halococcus saccharolyticus DSM 5350]
MPIVRTNDIDTYYERRGDGPVLLFVHAAIVDASQWLPQLEALSDEYTTIAYDVRGHGLTGRSEREEYSVDLFVDDLEALVEELELDQPVIVGLSTGGCIAQAYAVRHPESIAGLVLADTFTAAVLDWRDRVQFAALRATVPPARLVGYERVERVKNWFHERFDAGATGDYGNIERLRRGKPNMATDEFAKVIRAIADFPETTVDLTAITVPTLVLYGENELQFIRRHVLRIAAEIPDVTVRKVPNAGHAANLDNHEFFTAAMAAFLTDHIYTDRTPSVGEPGDTGEPV